METSIASEFMQPAVCKDCKAFCSAAGADRCSQCRYRHEWVCDDARTRFLLQVSSTIDRYRPSEQAFRDALAKLDSQLETYMNRRHITPHAMLVQDCLGVWQKWINGWILDLTQIMCLLTSLSTAKAIEGIGQTPLDGTLTRFLAPKWAELLTYACFWPRLRDWPDEFETDGIALIGKEAFCILRNVWLNRREGVYMPVPNHVVVGRRRQIERRLRAFQLLQTKSELRPLPTHTTYLDSMQGLLCAPGSIVDYDNPLAAAMDVVAETDRPRKSSSHVASKSYKAAPIFVPDDLLPTFVVQAPEAYSMSGWTVCFPRMMEEPSMDLRLTVTQSGT